eukprot:5800577-Prymnesium_polylepis.1
MAMEPSPYSMDETAILKYDNFFSQLDIDGRRAVSLVQCATLFEKAQLAPAALSGVMALADADGDGMLDRVDFRIAMHLLHLAVRGFPVPSSIPAALAVSSWGVGTDDAPPVAALSQPPPFIGADGVGIAPSELLHYRTLFLAHEPAPGVGLEGDAAVDVLSHSELPWEA